MRVSDPTAEAIAATARDTSHEVRVRPWRLKTARCAAVVPGLNRRALHRAEGAEHATAAGLGSKSSVALGTFVDDNAGGRRHEQPLGMAQAGQVRSANSSMPQNLHRPRLSPHDFRLPAPSTARPSASSPDRRPANATLSVVPRPVAECFVRLPACRGTARLEELRALASVEFSR